MSGKEAARVLLYCPTFERGGKLALNEQTQAYLDGVRESSAEAGLDVEVVIDASQPHHPYDANDLRNSHENTLMKYQAARQRALEGGFDALYTVEHDMIIPPDALVKLWQVKDAAVVYGAYMFRSRPMVLNLLRYIGNGRIDQTLQFFTEDYRRARRAGVFRVSGAGFGCTLIRREALERVEMRRNHEAGHPAPDMPFAMDCEKLHIAQKGHLGVICGHVCPDGTVLWPGRENTTVGLVKVRIIQAFIGNVRGHSQRYQRGDEVEMPEEEAREFSRCGWLELIGSADVKVVNAPFSKTGKQVKVKA